ncbi:hypothetical protein, partial [uncultured Paracoccus sp.]|uniref:hypothetical protein n=1 Tax=uncultured Paracoccus sp. TaxID=189685 RepID=UPI00261F7DBF
GLSSATASATFKLPPDQASPTFEHISMEPGAPIYVWPYAPAMPGGMDPLSNDAKAYYVTTAGAPVTRQAARALLDQAKRPARIGGFPEDLPPTWVAVVANWQEVARLSRETEARP